MPTDNAAIVKQIDEVLARVDVLTGPGDYRNIPNHAATEAVSLITSTIERFAPLNSSYLKNASLSQVTSYFQAAIDPLKGVLRALRFAYENGYLASIQALVHADLFADFLDMSEHLLEQGYKDPAAVLVGSVLEEHLRKLATRRGVGILKPDGSSKKADSINSDLAAASAYSKLDQKSVTAWLDLRNKAAHGHYPDYTKDQVALMLQSVQNFISRFPA